MKSNNPELNKLDYINQTKRVIEVEDMIFKFESAGYNNYMTRSGDVLGKSFGLNKDDMINCIKKSPIACSGYMKFTWEGKKK